MEPGSLIVMVWPPTLYSTIWHISEVWRLYSNGKKVAKPVLQFFERGDVRILMATLLGSPNEFGLIPILQRGRESHSIFETRDEVQVFANFIVLKSEFARLSHGSYLHHPIRTEGDHLHKAVNLPIKIVLSGGGHDESSLVQMYVG